jgi:Ca-activated chloride channel family protein
LAQATDRNRFRAVEWLSTVSERGGTEMALPLSTAAELLAGGDLERDRVLVFVTDGQVGNEAQVLKSLGSRLRGSRVFALGIDQAVNAGFMNRLAALGGQGEAELVENEDRVDDVLVRCHRRIDTPLVRDLQVRIEDGDLVDGSVAPSRLPDVFDGVPAVIVGKLRRRGSTKPTLVVTGTDASGGRFSSRVPVETSGNKALVPAWGRLRLRDLEDAFDGGKGDRATLNRQIVEVSLATKVLCRFTAFVAVDHEVVNRGGRVQQFVQPVESPAGWGASKSPMTKGRPAPSSALQDIERDIDLSDDDHGDFEEDDVDADGAVSMALCAPIDDHDDGMPLARSPAAPARLSIPAPRAVPLTGERLPTRAEAPARAPAKGASTKTADLSAFADRLRDLIAVLKTLGASARDDVIESLRLIIEEAAFEGVSPAARTPLVEATAALERGALDEAIRILQAAVDALPKPRRGGSFWG